MQNNIRDIGHTTSLTITKLDLTRSVHHNVGLSKTNSAKIIDQIISLVTESLASGKNVKLSNFGTFQLIDKAERTGRNPRTNEEVSISPRRVVTFKASSKLTQRIIDANAKSEAPAPGQLADQKREVLSALGNKLGSDRADLDFIFKSATEQQVQKDVKIPDVRAISS